MRENRPSGSEGGGAGTQTGPSYPYVRLQAHTIRRVEVPSRLTLRACSRT
jgi:hypothetical protein